MSITIREGGLYRTRDGRKVGPMLPVSWPIISGRVHGNVYDVRDFRVQTGEHAYGTPALDLVAEWTDEPSSPVVTETVKRIVPGTYGIVSIAGDDVGPNAVTVDLSKGFLTASELRAAAKVFTDLADALEDGAAS